MELPQGIDSKFRYILVAAKRAHQLHGGAKARVQSESQKSNCHCPTGGLFGTRALYDLRWPWEQPRQSREVEGSLDWFQLHTTARA